MKPKKTNPFQDRVFMETLSTAGIEKVAHPQSAPRILGDEIVNLETMKRSKLGTKPGGAIDVTYGVWYRNR